MAPFALIGSARPRRFLLGALLALALLAAAALLAFGPHAFDAIGLGRREPGTRDAPQPALPRLAAHRSRQEATRAAGLAVYALVLAWLLRWCARGADWLRAAGWAGLGLLLASGWVLPWYVLWPLPLAALSRDRPLAFGLLAFTALHLATRIPL